MDVGTRIKHWRERKVLGQAELAAKAGISVTGLSRIELGQRKPRPSTVRKIAEALGVDAAMLMGIEE